MTTKYTKCSDKLLLSVDSPLWIRDLEVDVPEKTGPEFTWKGGKIPFKLWRQIMAFMLWSQATFKSEAMGTLFYNKTSGEWAFDPPFQLTRGLSVTTDDGKKAENDALRSQFGKGWLEFGSVHHHCTMQAFSSGTDDQDETEREGLHITLGDLDEKILSIHGRMILGQNKYETVNFSSWFDLSEVLTTQYEFKGLTNTFEALGVNIETFLTHTALTSVEGIEEVTFPEAWAGRVAERPLTAHSLNGYGYGGKTYQIDDDDYDYMGGDWQKNTRSTWGTTEKPKPRLLFDDDDADEEVVFTFRDMVEDKEIDPKHVLFDSTTSRPYMELPAIPKGGVVVRRYLQASRLLLRKKKRTDWQETEEDLEDDWEEEEDTWEEEQEVEQQTQAEEEAKELSKGRGNIKMAVLQKGLLEAKHLYNRIRDHLNGDPKKNREVRVAVKHFLKKSIGAAASQGKHWDTMLSFTVRLTFIYAEDRGTRWDVQRVLEALKVISRRELKKAEADKASPFLTMKMDRVIRGSLLQLLPEKQFILSLKILEVMHPMNLHEILAVTERAEELTSAVSDCYIQRRASFYLPMGKY